LTSRAARGKIAAAFAEFPAPPDRRCRNTAAGISSHTPKECAMSQRQCPVTRAQFAADAKPLPVQLNGSSVIADAREFSTGSLGWYHNGKTTVQIGGVQVWVQVGVTVTVIGSKELPK
jgi:hypothetical protein